MVSRASLRPIRAMIKAERSARLGALNPQGCLARWARTVECGERLGGDFIDRNTIPELL